MIQQTTIILKPSLRIQNIKTKFEDIIIINWV